MKRNIKDEVKTYEITCILRTSHDGEKIEDDVVCKYKIIEFGEKELDDKMLRHARKECVKKMAEHLAVIDGEER